MPAHLLLLVAFSLAAACYGERTVVGRTGTYYNPSMCHESLPCGGNVDVHYPFFLANATMAIDGYWAYSPYCGYAGMAIVCDGGYAVLMLSGRSYTVLDIDYENHAITLADTDLIGSDDDCPRVTHNVTLPEETRLKPTDDDSLSFFFDCVFTPGNPQPLGILPINCSSFQSGGPGTMSFVALQSDVQQQDRWTRACKTVVLVPVLQDWRLNPEYHLHLNSDGYGQVLKRGFQLSWEPSAGPCYVCEQTKGKCSYRRNGEFLGCLCSDGSLRNQDCGKPIYLSIYIASSFLELPR